MNRENNAGIFTSNKQVKAFLAITPITSPFHSCCFSHPHSPLHYVTPPGNGMLQLEVIKTPAALPRESCISCHSTFMLSLPFNGAGTNLGTSNPICCIFPYSVQCNIRSFQAELTHLGSIYGRVLPPVACSGNFL